jgi:hypothetical protein
MKIIPEKKKKNQGTPTAGQPTTGPTTSCEANRRRKNFIFVLWRKMLCKALNIEASAKVELKWL